MESHGYTETWTELYFHMTKKYFVAIHYLFVAKAFQQWFYLLIKLFHGYDIAEIKA